MARNQPVDVSFVRSLNQRIVLDAIFKNKTTSRVQLAKSLSLSKPAISDNISSLIKLGIVSETGEKNISKSSGRRSMLLTFNERHKYIIAVDLNYYNPVFALTNLEGSMIHEFAIRISKAAPDDAYFNIIDNGISLLITSSGIPLEKILCIAIASPGVFDKDGNLLSQNLQYSGIPWCNINFKRELSKKRNVEVIIMNDINSAALGEWMNQKDKDDDNMLFISCGIGLGSGIILNGKLYEGKNYNAGEIYKYTDLNRIRDGKTLENTVCVNTLINKCLAFIENGGDTMLSGLNKNLSFEDIIKAFLKKDEFIVNVVTEICDELSVMALNYAMLFAVDEVVFGGDYIVFGDLLPERFRKNAETINFHSCNARLASLGRYSGIQGLVYTAREKYFDTICNI